MAVERTEPAVQGRMAVEHPFDFSDLDIESTAARFEPGAYNLGEIHGLTGSIELLLTVGVPALSERILGPTDLAPDPLEHEEGTSSRRGGSVRKDRGSRPSGDAAWMPTKSQPGSVREA